MFLVSSFLQTPPLACALFVPCESSNIPFNKPIASFFAAGLRCGLSSSCMDNTVRDAQSLLDRSKSALRNAGVLFQIPQGATSSEVRKAGLKSWLVGLICVATLGAGVPVLERFDLGERAILFVLVPYLVAFYLMIVGGYRVLLGKSPRSSADLNPYEVSWRRTLIGTGVAVLSIVVALGVIIPIAWLAEKLLK